jgi:hypothetical protein
MKTYNISIKSHNEAPDYEDWVKASNVEQASKMFALRISRVSEDLWSPKDLMPFIYEN